VEIDTKGGALAPLLLFILINRLKIIRHINVTAKDNPFNLLCTIDNELFFDISL